ncbi:MAG: hypothetical protein CMK32_07975 [Porticoccaceae bacterium]|nr:hypothetical protein [Porticoccaceae bacterium]
MAERKSIAEHVEEQKAAFQVHAAVPAIATVVYVCLMTCCVILQIDRFNKKCNEFQQKCIRIAGEYGDAHEKNMSDIAECRGALAKLSLEPPESNPYMGTEYAEDWLNGYFGIRKD